jgi:hypothetical protein
LVELSLSRAKVAGKLDMNGLRVGRALVMGDKAEFTDVVLVGAHVGDNLSLSDVKVSGKLDMNRLRVDQSVYARDKAEFSEVELAGAQVGGEIDLNGVKVTEKLDMNGLRVHQSVHLSDNAEFAEVNLTAAYIGGQLIISGSKVTGKLDCHELEVGQQVFMESTTFSGSIDCRVARIKGDLHLIGRFEKNVDLSMAEIGGSLLLESTQWLDGATLVLRDAKLGIIPTLEAAWAPKLDLDGFTYRSVGKADKFADWLGRFDRYAPQPYNQLASVVQSQGDSTLATLIRYSGRERERSEATGRAWAWLTALNWVIGYGYYPYFATFWVIGLVMAGAIILRLSGEGPRNGMPYGLMYSFDTLLPIIQLRKRHSDIDLRGWPRYYFYGQKIMGWALGTFLIAGLSGLTK